MITLAQSYDDYLASKIPLDEQIQSPLGRAFDNLFPIYKDKRISCVLYGKPAMGVSTIMMNLAKTYAENGIPVLFLTIDDGIMRFTERMLSPGTGLSQSIMDNIHLCDGVYSITELANLISTSQAKVLFVDTVGSLTVDQSLCATMRKIGFLGRQMNISVFIANRTPRSCDELLYRNTDVEKFYPCRMIIRRRAKAIGDTQKSIFLLDVIIENLQYTKFGKVSFTFDEKNSIALLPQG